MLALYTISGIALIISFIVNKQKTLKAIKIATKKFLNILPHFLLMIILVSVSLYFIPDNVIAKYLGGNNNLYLSTFIASLVGSISVMPGFIAFPLGGVLVQEGVSYTVIAAFTTTLMLVGILSFPIEKKFLGTKNAIIRNLIAYVVALIIAVVIGIFFREIF